MCVGDFNEIVDQIEKLGVALGRESQMDQFRTVLKDCSFRDLGSGALNARGIMVTMMRVS